MRNWDHSKNSNQLKRIFLKKPIISLIKNPKDFNLWLIFCNCEKICKTSLVDFFRFPPFLYCETVGIWVLFFFFKKKKKKKKNHKLTSPQYSLMKAFLRTESLTNIPHPAISDGANSRFYGENCVKKIIVLKIAPRFVTNAERS